MAKYKLYHFTEHRHVISQVYGARVDYYRDISGGALQRGHEGVDFPTVTGTPILCPFDKGIVVKVLENDPKYGKYVVVGDPVQKIAVGWGHLLDIAVKVGDEVSKGQVLCRTNNTGNTSGEHVHVNFMETDQNFYRLNRSNGSLGYLDIMDQNLVEFVNLPQAQAQTVSSQPTGTTKTIELELAIPVQDNPTDYMGIKKSDFQNMRGKCDTYDAMVAAGYDSLSDIDDMRKDLIQEKENMRNSYEGIIKEKDNEKLELARENKELMADKADILRKWEADVKKDVPTLSKGIDAMGKVNDLEKSLRAVANATGAKKPTDFFILTRLDEIFRLAEYFKKKAKQANMLETNKTQPKTAVKKQNPLKSFLKLLGHA